MIAQERKSQTLKNWIREQSESWRENWEEYRIWRLDLTQEEQELVKQWDAVTPEDDLNEYERGGRA